jgi:hypothetical protein
VALILFILASDILHAIKSYDMGPPALLTLWRKGCYRFLLPVKVHRLASAGFEHANFGSNGKHVNYYTTEATKETVTFCVI